MPHVRLSFNIFTHFFDQQQQNSLRGLGLVNTTSHHEYRFGADQMLFIPFG
jgi:hypothetical protein